MVNFRSFSDYNVSVVIGFIFKKIRCGKFTYRKWRYLQL